MPQFNATDAIFFGFRVVKRDPTLLIALTALFSVVGIAGVLLTARETAELAIGFEALSQAQSEANPDEALARMMEVYGAYLGSPSVWGYFLASVLASLAAQGAILRSLVHDRREGWVMGLQLGGDELRIFVVSLVVWILVGLVYVGGVFVLGVVGALLAALVPALSALFVFVGIFACLLGLALVGTRLSAAASASVGERKFVVFGSWRITKGRMWGLLGAHVVLAFIVLAAGLFVFGAGAVVAPQAMGITQGMIQLRDVEEMTAAYRSPGYVFVGVLFAVLSVVATAAWSGVGAYAYRMLGGAAGYPNASPPDDITPLTP